MIVSFWVKRPIFRCENVSFRECAFLVPEPQNIFMCHCDWQDVIVTTRIYRMFRVIIWDWHPGWGGSVHKVTTKKTEIKKHKKWYPIGSLYGIFTYILLIFILNVGIYIYIYTPYMDPMGKKWYGNISQVRPVIFKNTRLPEPVYQLSLLKSSFH